MTNEAGRIISKGPIACHIAEDESIGTTRGEPGESHVRSRIWPPFDRHCQMSRGLDNGAMWLRPLVF